MMSNALVRRYAVSSLRPQHLWVNISIYVIGLGLIGILNGLALRSGAAFNGDLSSCLRSVYGQLLTIQLLLLWLWGGYGAGNALREEMLNKSYDFFQMLPLSSGQKLVGVAVGRNLLPLALAAVTAILQVLIGLVGKVPIFLQMQIAFIVVAATWLIWTVSVLSSVRLRKEKKQNRNTSVVVLIFFALWLIPGILHVVTLTSSVVKIENWTVPFFSADVPAILLTGAIALYIAFWATLGAMRQLSRSDLTIFSAAGSYGFLAGCQVIALGLFWAGLTSSEPAVWFIYAAVTHVLVIVTPFGLLRSYDQYMELSYDLARTHGGGRMLDRVFLTAVNPVAWSKLFGIWAVSSLVAAGLNSVAAVGWTSVLIVCVFFAWVVFMLLAELAIVGRPKNEKLKYLALFMALVYLFLPMILSGVLDEGGIFAFSFLGVWVSVAERVSENAQAEWMLLPPLLLNILLVAILAVIIRRRYGDILKARRSMLARNAGEPASV